jgi:putative phage-type endonuclease
MTNKTNLFSLNFEEAAAGTKLHYNPQANQSKPPAKPSQRRKAAAEQTALLPSDFSEAWHLPLVHGSEAWKQFRYSGITATDIPVIMGASEKTAFQLWQEKLGRFDDFQGNRQTEYGLHLEQLVCKWVAEDLNCTITPLNFLLLSKQEQTFMATVDAIAEIDGIKVPVEIKTAAAGWDGDEVPYKHQLQVQWQLLVTESPFGFIACLPFGMASRLIIKRIEANAELQAQMIAAAMDFVDCLKSKQPPRAVAKDLSSLPLEIEAEEYDVEPPFVSLYEQYRELEQAKKTQTSGLGEIEKQLKDLKAQMAQMMGSKPKAFFFHNGNAVAVSRKEVNVKEKLTPGYTFQRIDIKEDKSNA